MTLQHRVLNPPIPFVGQTIPAWTNTNMVDTGSGRLNLFAATLPGFIPGQTLQYRMIIRATRNGDTATKTTGVASIAVGDVLVQH